MKNIVRVLSRMVLIAALGLLFSFMAGTEVKAVDSCQVCLYVDPSEGGTTNPEPSFPTSMKPYNYNPGEVISITAIPNNGYIFRRWSATGGGTFADEYNASTTFNVPDIYASGVTAYFATAPTITFDANGGSCTTESAQVGTDKKLASLPTATRDGYRCTGWFTQATGGDPVTTSTEFTTSTTIYAHWENATAAPTITTTSLPNGTVGEAYSQSLQASGGSGALNWEITSGTPPHLSLSSSGVLSGTPDSVGEYTFTVKVTDALDRSDTKNLTITFDPAAVTHTVTYHVVNGKWDDDSTDDKSETTEDNGFLHNIPAVGNKPNANYRAGSWSPSVPDTETRITGNRTYTYTYAQNSPTYNVTVTTDGHGEAFANKRSGVSGTRVTLREVPDDGYRFKQWEVISGGVVLDNYRDSTPSFTIGSADVVIKAHFEKKEEHTRENDYGPEESKSEAAWTPEKAAATIAAEKAAKQQAAGTQIVAVQTMLRTFATTKPGGPGEAPTVINLDMTKVDILDRGTVNLLVLNNKFEYNIKISVVGGLTTTVKIPANFNFRPFIKADGTMNIHEVLWSIVQKKATRKGSIYMIRRE